MISLAVHVMHLKIRIPWHSGSPGFLGHNPMLKLVTVRAGTDLDVALGMPRFATFPVWIVFPGLGLHLECPFPAFAADPSHLLLFLEP
jgi:hypothetical protein